MGQTDGKYLALLKACYRKASKKERSALVLPHRTYDKPRAQRQTRAVAGSHGSQQHRLKPLFFPFLLQSVVNQADALR